MTDKFSIELVNESDLKLRLGAAVATLRQPRELLDRIGGVLEQNIEFRFDTKTAPDGSSWLPLAESTRKAYAAKQKFSRRTAAGKMLTGDAPGSLLERTRYMRDSLTHNASDTFVEVGFGDAIAGYHETGTSRGLPRRQLLTDDPIAGTLGADDRQDVYDEINDFLRALF